MGNENKYKGDNIIGTQKDKRRLGTDIPQELYTEFKQMAAIKYKFQKGYTNLALTEAIEDYIKKCKNSKG